MKRIKQQNKRAGAFLCSIWPKHMWSRSTYIQHLLQQFHG